ncbi:hypothetical protein A8F97_02780 [Pectobacterium parmentieri]|nr:hypothetical protein A8F97_02780 [Pectobacterium parmentieri]
MYILPRLCGFRISPRLPQLRWWIGQTASAAGTLSGERSGLNDPYYQTALTVRLADALLSLQKMEHLVQ